jgi:hypothetical protein
MILVGGRPDLRIDDIYDLRRVFVGGREVALAPLRRLIDADGPSPLPVHRMAGPIDTGARTDGRTDLGTLPIATNEAGTDHSRLHHVREDGRLLLTARLGASPEPHANLVLPLTPGAVHLADARGFTGIAFAARGRGRYTLIVESYATEGRDLFRTSFEAGAAEREVVIPFASLRSANPKAALDLARLRALVFGLDGAPGSEVVLRIGNVRFYR